MKAVPATSPRAERARERILAAAEEELAATGELEVAAVCRRAGVSLGLPYRYFDNRSAVLVAVVERFYARLWDAAAGREYAQPTWAGREQARIRDWIDFLYAEPLSVLILGGVTGDSAVTAAGQRQLRHLIDIGAHNISRAQQAGELPAGRDPELLAAAVLAGVHAATSTAIERTRRAGAGALFTEIWQFVRGAVGQHDTTEGT